MINVGIVGTGAVAEIHAQALSELPGARLTAVQGLNPESTEDFAKRWGATPYSENSSFLEHEGLSVVAICSPSGSHRDSALFAAAAGKHLFVEKPIEVTLRRSQEIVEACRNHGVTLGSVFQTRFHPAARHLKRAVDEGWFGRVSLVTADVKWYREQSYYDDSPWRGTWALDGGGALMNQSIHVVDLLLWLFGRPETVSASALTLCHTGIEVEDTLSAVMEFPHGPIGTITATTGAWPGSFKAVEVCGEYGHARLEENSLVRWEFDPTAPVTPDEIPEPSTSDVVDPRDIGCLAHRSQYQDFFGALERASDPEVGSQEALAAVDLVERIYRAAGIGPAHPPRTF